MFGDDLSNIALLDKLLQTYLVEGMSAQWVTNMEKTARGFHNHETFHAMKLASV